MFPVTRYSVSPIAGAQFLHLNVPCLFITQYEIPVLFPKCGNISQPDQCFHPPSMGPHTTCHNLLHIEKQRVAEGPLLYKRCRPHPRETLPVPQMSVDNYGGESNEPEQHEIPRALVSERPAVDQPFLDVHREGI